jgi:hypothetical protein
MLPGRAAGGLRGEDLRFDCNIATISGRLGNGREPGVEAKFCELDDKAFGSDFLRAAIEMIGAEILQLRTVLEHVVDRRKERGRDRGGQKSELEPGQPLAERASCAFRRRLDWC